MVGEDFVEHDRHANGGGGDDVGGELNGAQLQAEDVVGTGVVHLVHFHGHQIIAHHEVVGREDHGFRRTLVWLVGRGGAVDHRGGHAQRADPDAVEVIDRAVVDEIGRNQIYVGQAAVPLKVGSIINRDVAAGVIGRRNGGDKRVG